MLFSFSFSFPFFGIAAHSSQTLSLFKTLFPGSSFEFCLLCCATTIRLKRGRRKKKHQRSLIDRIRSRSMSRSSTEAYKFFYFQFFLSCVTLYSVFASYKNLFFFRLANSSTFHRIKLNNDGLRDRARLASSSTIAKVLFAFFSRYD
jgi:hypothetical protein